MKDRTLAIPVAENGSHCSLPVCVDAARRYRKAPQQGGAFLLMAALLQVAAITIACRVRRAPARRANHFRKRTPGPPPFSAMNSSLPADPVLTQAPPTSGDVVKRPRGRPRKVKPVVEPLISPPVASAPVVDECPAAPAPAEVDTAPGKIDESALTISEPRRLRDKAHLKFVGSQPCLICARSPADAHHLKFTQSRAMGRKVSDEFTVPLCRTHHRDNSYAEFPCTIVHISIVYSCRGDRAYLQNQSPRPFCET